MGAPDNVTHENGDNRGTKRRRVSDDVEFDGIEECCCINLRKKVIWLKSFVKGLLEINLNKN